jgi:eukaryotic-like serine/threonine-protein kinase
MTDPYIGRFLANRYRLISLLGKGAMGRVYRAEDALLGGVPKAVKFLANTLLSQRMRDRFAGEAQNCAALGEKSMHIVRVMDYGVDEADVPYYVMEYLEGKSLSDVIRQRPLPTPKFIAFARQICLGLQCAHQGVELEGKIAPVIHRDIKPSNILVCQNPTLGDLVKILDFGIAKRLQEDSEQTGSFMGTLAYASPEQMDGKELDSRSDIYSLGVMMFEMLTCELPLQPETHTFGSWYKVHRFQEPKSLIAAAPVSACLPPALVDLVMSCLAKSPSDRPQTVGDIIDNLGLIDLNEPPLPSRPSSQPAAPATPPPVAETSSTDFLTTPAGFLSVDQACREAVWPADKPVAEIVFPKIIATAQEQFVTLWLMLSQQEIQDRSDRNRSYNQFLYIQSPHPMALWITALYNRKKGARLLPQYVDLKKAQGQEILRLLGTQGHYRVLLFALEAPQHPVTTLVTTINAYMCPQLKEWAATSHLVASAEQPLMSKELLKTEYDKLKVEIIQKLEASSRDFPTISPQNYDAWNDG